MPRNFEFSRYAELLRESKIAFLADSAYAIAVAKPAGTFAARLRERAESEESSSTPV